LNGNKKLKKTKNQQKQKKLLGGSGHQLVTAAQSTPSHSNSKQQQQHHQVNNRGVCGGGAAAATTTTTSAAAAAAAAAANLEALANAYTAGIQQFTTGAFVPIPISVQSRFSNEMIISLFLQLKNTKHTRKQLILLPPSGFHTFNLFI
jgi:hypothetical protein